ncbi:MAG: hypothetical protein K2X77_05075 [Candidatus Obscuribacterales bacterium]|nr:hypothetical protein [Candidatus Obscuribacterales bacterium]
MKDSYQIIVGLCFLFMCSTFCPSALAQPSAPFVPSTPELQPIEALRKEAKAFVDAKNFNKAQATLLDALNRMETTIEPDIQKKTRENTPGYPLNRWHDCLREEAAIYKDLAGIYYKQSRMNEVQKAYERRTILRRSAGDELEQIEPDYEYLVTVCQANGDLKKAELYFIHLLKARRLMWGKESDSHVLATMTDFAKFERSSRDPEKATMLEERIKGIKTDAKPLPKLWFSF